MDNRILDLLSRIRTGNTTRADADVLSEIINDYERALAELGAASAVAGRRMDELCRVLAVLADAGMKPELEAEDDHLIGA